MRTVLTSWPGACWVVLALHGSLLALPILYWWYRDRDPIKSRRPGLMTAICAASVGQIVYSLTRVAAADRLGLWWDAYLGGNTFICFADGLILFAVSLYIAFNKTRDQLALSASLPPHKFQQLRRSIRLQTFLISDQFAARVVLAHVLLFSLTFTLYAALIDIRQITLSQSASSLGTGSVGPVLQLFLAATMVLTAAVVLALRKRLALVQDAFGSKRMLLTTAWICTAGIPFYFAALAMARDLGLHTLTGCIINDLVLLHCFVRPVWRCSRAVADVAPIVSDLEVCLMDPDGFTEFQRHLETEFAVESLLFWRDARQFRARYPQAAAESAAAIYHSFLSPTAPMELNLPASTSEPLLRRFDADGRVLALDIDMFDAAMRDLLNLMETDSLGRFLRTRPPAMERFLVDNTANQLMTNSRLSQASSESGRKMLIVTPYLEV